MRESTAWRIQAKSDLEAANKLAGGLTRPNDYCQVAAKTQQAVEKSVKALQTVLYQAGLAQSAVDSTHQVAKVASAIRTAASSWPKNVKSYRDWVKSVFSDIRLSTIKALDALVPQYPKKGDLPRRNTEYPFQITAGLQMWKAPAEVDAFSKREIEGFIKCAQDLQYRINKFVEALEKIYP